ncbi:MAG: 2-amino-3,7-dideoxy-D-threo-hept-6-ulosonate synthase [Thermoprotei archaeon]
MVSGKSIRLNRVLKNNRMLCVPMDHSVTIGPVDGLKDTWKLINAVAKGGASAVLAHKGVFSTAPAPIPTGSILHVNANTVLGPHPNQKTMVTTVKHAVRLGVDCVSIHVNVGSDEENQMLSDLGRLSDECYDYGIPLIAMMYPRGPRIKDVTTELVCHAARIGADFGADIVKTVYTGSVETFRQVVEACPVPVVLAGGPKLSDDLEVLKLARSALDAGALGVTFGRNVFAHPNPESMTRALSAVVYDGASPESAAKMI